jgi:hypothetical protein
MSIVAPTGTITSASAVFTISCSILPQSPVQLQQFMVDDIFDTDAMRTVEHAMGVDGTLSFGFVFVPMMMRVALQANSPSIAVFDTIFAQQQQAETVYPLSGTVTLPAISKKYSLSNGALEEYKPLPDAKRMLQGQRFQLVWNQVVPAPA